MRYSVLFIFTFVIFLFLFKTAMPQEDQFTCEMPQVLEKNQNKSLSITTVTHREGEYITSTGELRVLVIFVRFLGDNNTTDKWPNPDILPDWAQNFVDPTFSLTGDYYPGCVSDYFYKNSYGNLHITGDIYYVTTDYNEDYYHNYTLSHGENATRGLVEMEALDKLDNAPYNVNFANYDNWNRVSNYTIYPGTDNKVDMIWFITRNLHTEVPGRFDIGRATLDCSTHMRDGKTIVGGNSFPGSGISMFEPHCNV